MYVSVDFFLSCLYTMDIADHASQALPIWNAKRRHSCCEMRVIYRMTEYYINHIETGE